MLICGCKRELPVVMGTNYCARCTVEMELSGGVDNPCSVCLAKLEAIADDRKRQEGEMWADYDHAEDCDEFTGAIDGLGW